MYWPFSKSFIQGVLAYKFGFVSWVLSNFLQVAIVYFLWRAIFDSSAQGLIQGFTFLDMQVHIIMSFVTGLLVSLGVEWKVASEIGGGSIAMSLAKPINYFLRLVFESLGNFLLRFVTVAIPVWIFMPLWHRFVYDAPFPALSSLLLFFLSLSLSISISFLINFILGLSAFFVTYIWGFLMCKDAVFKLLSGAMIPLVMFPDSIQKVMTYLPFASLNNIPVMIYMRKFNSSEIAFYLGVQLFWMIAFIVLAGVLWKMAIKRLSVAGG